MKLVGEPGPELVIPLGPVTILSPSAARELLSEPQAEDGEGEDA